jgi:3-oxoacyl-[acyl-carrier protein] reductase
VNGRLAGRTAIVTGAGHGIGCHYAAALGAEGARVAVVDIDAAAAAATAARLAADGVTTVSLQADISDEAAVAAMVGAVCDAWGGVDVLVNNAGIYKTVPMTHGGVEEVSAEEFDRMFRVNVLGTWLVCRAVVPAMRRQGYGKIVNIGSTLGLRAPHDRGTFTHYGSSKAAVHTLTKWLARELGPQGIRVNAIAPGGVLTSDDPEEERALAASVADRALQRVQRPADLVGPLVFLASADSDFVTGQTLVVDGGSFML